MKWLDDYIWVALSLWGKKMAKLSQHQELQQKLSPQQILQASLLQLNAQVLEQRILEEIEKKEALDKYGSEGSGKNLPFSSLSEDLKKKEEDKE